MTVKNKYNAWRPEEDVILKANYHSKGARACAKLLVAAGFDRTSKSCEQRARRFELYSSVSRRAPSKSLGKVVDPEDRDLLPTRRLHLGVGEWRMPTSIPCRWVFDLGEAA